MLGLSTISVNEIYHSYAPVPLIDHVELNIWKKKGHKILSMVGSTAERWIQRLKGTSRIRKWWPSWFYSEIEENVYVMFKWNQGKSEKTIKVKLGKKMIKNTRELLDYSCICRIIMYISKSNPMAFEIEGVEHQTESVEIKWKEMIIEWRDVNKIFKIFQSKSETKEWGNGPWFNIENGNICFIVLFKFSYLLKEVHRYWQRK